MNVLPSTALNQTRSTVLRRLQQHCWCRLAFIFSYLASLFMSFSPKHAPLRNAVAHLMLAPEFANITSTFDRLITPLTVLSGVKDDRRWREKTAAQTQAVVPDNGEGGESVFAEIDRDLLMWAFKKKGADTEYIDSYVDLGVKSLPSDGERHYLLVRAGKRGGRDSGKTYEVGRFTRMDHETEITLQSEIIPVDGEYDNDDHPLRLEPSLLMDFGFYKRLDTLIPAKVKWELQNYLRVVKADRKKNKSKSGGGKKKKRKSSLKQPSPSKLATTSTPTKIPKKRKKEDVNPAEELRLVGEYTKLKKVIAEKVGAEAKHLSDIAARLKDMRKFRLEVIEKVKKQQQLSESNAMDTDEGSTNRAAAAATATANTTGAVPPETATANTTAAVPPETATANTTAAVPPETATDTTVNPADPATIDDETTEPATTPIDNFASGTLMSYIVNGRVGQIKLGDEHKNSGMVFLDDLDRALHDLPPEMDNEKSHSIRAKRGIQVGRYGQSFGLVPTSTEIIAKAVKTNLTKQATIAKNLEDLMDGGEQTSFSPEALSIWASYNLSNYGGSDESSEMLFPGVLEALFHDIGFECDPSNLAKACPSKTTIARYDLNLAVDCLMKVLQEIKDDGAKLIGVMMDHGHRAKQDHFVIVIVWSGLDRNGRMTYKYFCPSIDSAGHTGDEAADAVKNVIERFLADDTVEVFVSIGDAGGGASIQKVHPKLQKNGLMKDDSKVANCANHGIQKSLENASKETMGDQGMGSRTPFQMLYVFALLMSRLRDEGSISFVDSLWSTVQDRILTDERFEDDAMNRFRQAYEKYQEEHNFEEMDDDDLERYEKVLTESPKNIQDPTFSRWQTTVETAKILLKYWIEVHYLAVGVKTHYKSDSYIWKVACTLISLMNERAKASLTDNTNIDSFIDSAEDSGDDLQSQSSPTFYTMLLFQQAFCNYAHNDNWGFLLRDDPYFGDGTFGQLARFMPERIYVMQKMIDDLKGGGWQDIDQFQEFLTAVERVPIESDNSCANREYFMNLPDKFIGVYERTLHTHVLGRWRSGNLLSCMFGGEPALAKELGKALFARKIASEDGSLAVNDDGDAVNTEPVVDQFSDDDLTLGEHHTTTQGEVNINIMKCMTFLTANDCSLDKCKCLETKSSGKLDDILKEDRFVNENWNLIEKLAMAPIVVRLFDRVKDAEGNFVIDDTGNYVIDESTWGDVDYKPLIDGIWRHIGIIPHHSQRCENYVQLAALVSKTLVGEARRTWRAISVSSMIRPFNREALETLRKAEKDPKKRALIKRVSGRRRIRMYSRHVRRFREKVGRARKKMGEAKRKEILQSIAKSDNKAGAAERKRRVINFEKDMAEALDKQYKAELEEGFDGTSLMNQRVKLTAISVKNKNDNILDAELIARGIPTESKEFIKEFGEGYPVKVVGIKRKKYYLKVHEANKLIQKNPTMNLVTAMTKTSDFEPFSQEAKALLL